ncbi:hypothetical protein D3C78_1153690 [compost metagenome]
MLGAVGEGAYFIRDHGKTATGFPGARRFDGGIERQQVGLLRHRADHIQHLANVTNLPGQLLQALTAGLHFAGHGAGAIEVVADLLAALLGQLIGGIGRL